MMPGLTVLMPVYNAERFLREAIDSILQQTYKDFDFLLIDDGSTDSSVTIIQSYQDPRIRFYQNEKNLGISATLNKGIELAETDYIARMDADDVSYPDRLEKQLHYLQTNPDCAMVSSFARIIDEGGQFVRQDRMKSEHFYYNLTFICWIYHPTVMYRKDSVKEVGMYTATYSEDFELFWQLSRRYRIHTLPATLLDYRETSQSLHQVLKKEEYEQAQQAQVLRNLRYYAGNSYTIPISFIECYRHNFQPLLAEKKLNRIVACVKELDYITQSILNTANPNLERAPVKLASYYKRRYIISYLTNQLPLLQKLMLLYQLETFESLIKQLKVTLKRFVYR
ncbi:glycosyltransferase family 2 protein [Pontibacter ruber]|uniref:Glycosyltransferase family 2 protein n=1 Tax=Pontibacter ruber TaxID=1343895 RepID=A0ABW5D1R6_9BACT|nr:glycosyltransferase [Pontibacter ruber]